VNISDLPTPALVIDADRLEREAAWLVRDGKVIDQWSIDLRGW
jgi:D-serine deaminase-like pyridoxal phosphate-dependent protein